MVYMNIDDDEIISTSPETLVRLQNGRLYTFPVAGSRPRGKTDEEDIALERSLLSDEKSFQNTICLLTSAEMTLEEFQSTIP